MYRIIKENEVVAVVDKLHFCRPQANGIPCLTDEANAHGIVIDDAFFHIEGFPEWEGKETVKYEEFAGAAAIATAQAELAEARSELSEILIAAREGLVSPPSPGAPWNAQMHYTTGDTVEGGYVVLRYSRGKDPADTANIGVYWEIPQVSYPAWIDIEDGTVITEDTIVTHDGKAWRCISQHIKSAVYKPHADSTKWAAYNA